MPREGEPKAEKENPEKQQLTPAEAKTIRELMIRVGIDRATHLFMRCYFEWQWMIPKSKRQLARDIIFKKAKGPVHRVVDAPYRFFIEKGVVHLNDVPIPFSKDQAALFSLAFEPGRIGHASFITLRKKSPQSVRAIVLRMHEAIDDGAHPLKPELLKKMLRSDKGIRIVADSTLL